MHSTGDPHAQRALRWFGTGMLVLGLGSGMMLLSSFKDTDFAANVGRAGCSVLLDEVRAQPLPYDSSIGPLSITASLVRPGARVVATVGSEDAPLAVLPLEFRGRDGSTIWTGRGDDGRMIPAGTYALLLEAADGRCSERRSLSIDVRPSVIPFVALQIGETLRLGSHTVADDADSGLAWTSSDAAVAIVEEGNVLRALVPGTVRVAPDATLAGGWAMQPIEIRVVP